MLFGGVCLYAGVLGLRSTFEYRALSVRDGRDISTGELVGVKGTVVDRGALTSPFTGQVCVAHKWTVERRTQDHERGREWESKKVEGDIQSFTLETDDGTYVTVEPGDDVSPRADIVVGTEVIQHVAPGDAPPERFQELIENGVIDGNDASVGAAIDEALGNADRPLGTRRYRERAITEGDEIYLYGSAERVGDGLTIGRGAVFAVSDSTDAEIADQRLGQTVVVTLAGALSILFGAGFLL